MLLPCFEPRVWESIYILWNKWWKQAFSDIPMLDAFKALTARVAMVILRGTNPSLDTEDEIVSAIKFAIYDPTSVLENQISLRQPSFGGTEAE